MRCLVRLVALCLPLIGAAAAAVAAEPLILAVHPYLPPGEITQRFTPLAEVLSRTVGRPVFVRVGRSYAEHIDAIGTDSVDIAYVGPAAYVTLVNGYGGKPLLARQVVDGDPMLHGEIIVRQDSPIRSLAELRGKRFAFGDPDSTMSHVVAAAMLRDAGVPESALAQADFLNAHRNVALAVLAGDFDAGAVKEEVYVEFQRQGLRSIAQQPPVADHLFVTAAKLPAELVAALRQALLTLPDTPAGRAALTAIAPGMTGMVAVRDSDYDSLRTLMRVAPPPGRHGR